MGRIIMASMVSALALVLGGVMAAEHTTDNLETVKSAVANRKAVLVDVREIHEWNDGHLKNARHLALSELRAGVSPDRLKQLIPPGSVVYLHCAAGGRCLNAADILKKYGYDVRPLKDGYDNLIQAGFEKAK